MHTIVGYMLGFVWDINYERWTYQFYTQKGNIRVDADPELVYKLLHAPIGHLTQIVFKSRSQVYTVQYDTQDVLSSNCLKKYLRNPKFKRVDPETFGEWP